ncbi:MAG: ROK family protein [Candidatus Omnitrophota bacterium]
MKRYTAVIDLGGTNIKAALIRDERHIILRKNYETARYGTRGLLIDGLAGIILGIIREAKISKQDVNGVGIGAPGVIDSRRGIIHDLVNIEGFKDVPLKKLIEKKTGLPVFLDNDVNVMTLGELYHGAGRAAKDMLCITLGTGVGGGIVIDGKLYRGSSLSAGEIGHMPLNEEGHPCNCGGSACLERSIGNKHIIALALRKIHAKKRSLILRLAGGDPRKITPQVIHAAAQAGDKDAIAVWEETGRHLGVTLAGVVNLLNPGIIVIGGGVSQAGRFLFDPLRETIRKRAMRMPANHVKIVRAKLGQDAGLIGAAVLVRLGGV